MQRIREKNFRIRNFPRIFRVFHDVFPRFPRIFAFSAFFRVYPRAKKLH